MNSIKAAPRSLIIALDIGTHASGFSWVKGVTADGKPRGLMSQHESWPDQPVPYPKARSAILYHGGKPIEWGWSAGKRYSSVPAHDVANYTYIEDFKLALQDARHAASLGGRLTPEQVMTDFLTLFIKYVKKTLQRFHGVTSLDISNCQWCLTVPAMWTLDSKAKMRKAAYRAGLIRSLDSDQLMIILEPEAAALHAMGTRAPPLHPGQTVAIVDVGGGTADITVHNVKTVNSKTVLAEAVAAHGELCGSQYVDEEFKWHLCSKVGRVAYDTWSTTYPGEVRTVMDRWTVCKYDFKGAASNYGGARVPLPPNLLDCMDSMTKEMLARQQGLSWGHTLSSLVLSPGTMQSLFEAVVAKVVSATMEQLQAASGVSTVIVVGGFASNPYLQLKLKTAIHMKYPTANVVVPDRPYAAVLLGAVLYGCDPSLIHARRSKLCYGVRACTSEILGAPAASLFVHPEKHVTYSNVRFFSFVKRGQLVGHDEEFIQDFVPLYKWQTAADFPIYATEDTTAIWVVEDGRFHELGRLKVNLSEAFKDRDIKVCFKFGATELVPTAWDPQRGEKVSAAFRFASDKA